jgi:hypothetical protein
VRRSNGEVRGEAVDVQHRQGGGYKEDRRIGGRWKGGKRGSDDSRGEDLRRPDECIEEKSRGHRRAVEMGR